MNHDDNANTFPGFSGAPDDLMGESPSPEGQQDGPFVSDSLGSGFDDGMGAAPKNRATGQILILALALTAGGGLLYGMRYYGLKSGEMAFDEQIVKFDPRRDAPFDPAEHRRVLDDLGASRTSVQVPLDEVARNPFVIAQDDATAEVNPSVSDRSREQAERERRAAEALARRERQIREALGRLKLDSVLDGGARPIARISGQAVTIGDRVGSDNLFTVVKIERRTVTLSADDTFFVLSMDPDRR